MTDSIWKTLSAIDCREEKWLDLVWYARKPRMGNGQLPSTTELQAMEDFAGTPDDIIKGMLKGMMRVQEKYPTECAELDGEGADWSHGFNSGMLAALRLIRGLEAGGEEADDAASEFPELYT